MPRERLTTRWPAVNDTADSLQCTLTARGDDDAVDCGIFHCPTAEVAIDKLPSTWNLNGVDYNTVTLPCGHHYNPSALALHFLTLNMRCPVCRQGHDECMYIHCLPPSIRTSFAQKKQEVLERGEQEDTLLTLLQSISIDISEIERDFRMVMVISTNQHSRVILQTPIQALASLATGRFVPFRTQQSFQRILNLELARFCSIPNTTISFSIQHPVMFLAMQTQNVLVSEFCESLRQGRRALPFFVDDHDETSVVAAIVIDGERNQACLHHMGLYIDRDNMTRLCFQCINAHLQQLVQQQFD